MALARLLWQAYCASGLVLGSCLWAALLLKGTFENFFEAPFDAIPFDPWAGLAAAPLFGSGSPALDHQETG